MTNKLLSRELTNITQKHLKKYFLGGLFGGAGSAAGGAAGQAGGQAAAGAAGGMGMSGWGAIAGMAGGMLNGMNPNNNNLKGSSFEQGVDKAIEGIPMIGGFAQFSNAVTGFIPRNEDGSYKSVAGSTAANIISPHKGWVDAIEGLQGDHLSKKEKVGSVLSNLIPGLHGALQSRWEPPAPREPFQFTKQTQIAADGGPTLHPQLAYKGGGMRKLFTANGTTVYQTLGKPHSKGGIHTKDGKTEYEGDEVYMENAEGEGYFVRKELARPMMQAINRELTGSRNRNTLQAIASKAMYDNEVALLTENAAKGNRSVNALGGFSARGNRSVNAKGGKLKRRPC